VRRVGRYEVVTYQNATVPDVVVHAAADTRPTSLSRDRAAECSADHVTSDDVTPPQVQSPDAAVRRPPPADGDDRRKLSTRGGGASSSLPQLSLASGRQNSALDETGNNNVSLGALHAAAYVDAASQRQTLIRLRACRPCHDLSNVTHMTFPRSPPSIGLVLDRTSGCLRLWQTWRPAVRITIGRRCSFRTSSSVIPAVITLRSTAHLPLT